ncbi:MAG: ComEA family DNA-binding protein, partial [Peptococcia bacterium]
MNSIPRKGQILGIIILGMFFCVGFYRYYSLRVSPANVLEFEITEQTPLEPPQEQEKTQFIKVHIVGAVEKPGVYSLEEGKRIDDVVKLAIPTKEADLSLINLASLLE